MSNPSLPSLNIPNEQLLLINILNTMYNDNMRQINSLTTANNEIRGVITNLLSNSRGNYNNNNNNNNYNYNSNQNRYRNRNNTRDFFSRTVQPNIQERTHNSNNSPYIIEEVQEYSIPYSQLQNWINNSQRPQQRNPPQNQNRENIFTTALQRFLEPVEIFPTQSQIESATRRAMYCDIVSPINRSCPISLETFNDSDIVSVIRHCGHIFNTQYLNTWFRRNCRCPICRYDIRNYNSSSSRQTDISSNNVTPSPPSVPLNVAENNQTDTTRSTALAYISSYLESMGDVGSLFSDISGNVTIDDLRDPSVLLTLFTSATNNNR